MPSRQPFSTTERRYVKLSSKLKSSIRLLVLTLARIRYPLRMAETQRLSPEAHARLSAEFLDLTTRGRIEIADKIEAGSFTW